MLKVTEVITTALWLVKSEVEELSKELENSDIATDYVKAGEITDKITELQDKIESLMEEWERLQMIIEESGYDV